MEHKVLVISNKNKCSKPKVAEDVDKRFKRDQHLPNGDYVAKVMSTLA